MEFKISLVKKKELKECAKILMDIYNNNVLNEGWTEATSLNTCNFFFNQNKDLFFVVKDTNNKIIGFTYSFIKPWSQGNMLMIEEISVDKNYIRQGIANALMIKLIETAIEKYNITSVSGEAYLDKDAKWIPFNWYQKIGFCKTETLFLIEGEPNEILSKLNR